MWLGIASIIIGFLLGSFPSAYIVTKLRKGADIRKIDYTGNMGAGAVFRQVGLWEGAVVTVADIGKGAVAVLAAQAMGVTQPWVLGAGFAAILGHSYPPYIGFRGGQGVATIIGIFLVLTPKAMACTLGVLGLALLLTRHIFTMTCIAAPFLPLFIWVFDGIGMVFYLSLVIIAFVLFKTRNRLREFRVKADKTKESERLKPAHRYRERASIHNKSKATAGDSLDST
jgi:glycerol-3-phosphate acyltransferase PlsY